MKGPTNGNANGLTRIGRFMVRHPFWFGFLWGFCLPAYIAYGAAEGLRNGLDEWRGDRDVMRRIITRAPGGTP